MDRVDTLESRIEEIQNEISLLEAPYERSIKRAKGEDEEWNDRSGTMLSRILRLVEGFAIGDNGEKAIAIVAQCNVLAKELTAHEKIIDTMKEKKALLQQAQKDLDRSRPPDIA